MHAISLYWFAAQQQGWKSFSVHESLLLKANSRACCAPHNSVPCHVPNEIDYGKINFETNSGTAVSTRMTSLTWRH